MASKTVPPAISVPGSSGNPHGYTIKLSKFDMLNIKVPSISQFPIRGNVHVYNNDRLVASVPLTIGMPDPIDVSIQPYLKGCCWQTLRYEVVHVDGNVERSANIHLLIEDSGSAGA